ncbi:alpha/beta fold hydrolase [Psychromonas hadalis]|uniref:alpha/beta fold hydrolase n=1 Tax=Psychromonas hadalis TaxID=211669 RepID=UPI001FE1B184|nr:alpha/beta hydrolase [Psychromonas hadalis]
MMILRSVLPSLMVVFLLLVQINKSHAEQSTPPQEPFFSLKEIKNAQKKELMPVQYLQASDETSLAFRAYLPRHAQAILIFYHGAGAHSGLSYNHIGAGLRDDFEIAVYMPDLRGHGSSGGARGDAPSDEQVWSDINAIVKHVRVQYPSLPLFIGGHSGGAGLALNYSSWEQRAAIDGYLFLAPYFGFRSETSHDQDKNGGYTFSSVNVSDFVINTMSGGLFLGHAKAVKFNFPKRILEKNPEIVPFNTVNMSKAVTPYSPDTQFSALQQFGLWIGEKDEAFDPVKVTLFAQKNSAINTQKEIKIVEGENHFSIILKASQFMGLWITRTINQVN